MDKFSTVSHSIISGLTMPSWPSNKDIPLFVGVPVIMNHRVYLYIWRTMRKLQAHKTKNESDAHVSRFSHVV